MSKKLTTEQFIERSNLIHNKRYDYSKVCYVNNHTKICIICPEHGEFLQMPREHLYGQGCKLCAYEKIKLQFRKTQSEFIEEANKVHQCKYDYSNVNYIDGNTNVEIICKKHGSFLQKPYIHLNGCGCPQCGNEKLKVPRKYDTERFINDANEIHKNKYDYSNVKYINSYTKVNIICPKHGVFFQIPSVHLNGSGCPKCVSNIKSTNEEFIRKANIVHKNKYDYSNVKYINNVTRVCIMCRKHGEFSQTPHDHLEGCGCPKCGNLISKAEDDIYTVIKNIGAVQRNKEIIKPYEIDVYVPSLKLGIEYNGLRWHSEEFGKDHRYHLDKLNECNKQGVKLIQIFEDEWVNHREICESKLKQICGLNTNPKIFGRKCEIHEIKNKNDAYDFLDKNHIQCRTGCTVALGAYYNDNLVGVMTFKREKEGYWDLNRFATDINYQCVGVGGKLFKYFTQHYDFQEIKSFADRRWTTDPTDNLYTKLGFEFDSFVEPTYWYYNPKVAQYKRFHKFGFRKQPLHHQYGLPLTMTEREMTTSLGYTRIWDCGLIKYVYKAI